MSTISWKQRLREHSHHSIHLLAILELLMTLTSVCDFLKCHRTVDHSFVLFFFKSLKCSKIMTYHGQLPLSAETHAL